MGYFSPNHFPYKFDYYTIWFCYIIQAALTERETLQTQNVQLQHKLAEYFRKKKTDDQRQEMDKNVTDQEQRYLKYMCEFLTN